MFTVASCVNANNVCLINAINVSVPRLFVDIGHYVLDALFKPSSGLIQFLVQVPILDIQYEVNETVA